MPSPTRKLSTAAAACAPAMPKLLRKVSTAAAACARRDAPKLLRKVSSACARIDAPSIPSLVRKASAAAAAAACARRDAPSMPSLVRKASTAAAACARRASREARRVLLRARARRPRRDFSQLVPTTDDPHQDAGEEEGGEEEEEEEEEGEGLWRRTVLMGERCKPLDFPGAIHYDSAGRLLPAPRSPRGGGAAGALLLCRSATACDVVEAATARGKARLAKKHV